MDSRTQPSKWCLLFHPRLNWSPFKDKLAKSHSTQSFRFSSWPLPHHKDMTVVMVWAPVFLTMAAWAFKTRSICTAISPALLCRVFSTASLCQHNYMSCTASQTRELILPKLNMQKTEEQIQKVLISFLSSILGRTFKMFKVFNIYDMHRKKKRLLRKCFSLKQYKHVLLLTHTMTLF